MSIQLLLGDCRAVLLTLPADSVHCVVTSPPYWGLRDYGIEGQLGLEPTPEEYVERMVAVFHEVRRVLRDDGTCWANMGDTFSDKQLVGMPWRLAFALQADGWFLRSDIIWAKPNPMPESVTDRPTKAHEYVFLLTKSARYYYDADAVREPWADDRLGGSATRSLRYSELSGRNGDHGLGPPPPFAGRNLRSVWTIATAPYPEAHFATFPPELARRCIVAGSRMGDTILDLFAGSGTVGEVAEQNGRDAILIELSPAYVALARARTAQMGLFTSMGLRRSL